MTTYHPDTPYEPAFDTSRNGNGSDSERMSDKARAEYEKRRAQASDAAERTRQQMADTAEKTKQQVTENARKASDQTAQFVRENPGMALAGAVGVGILLGLALRNRY